MLKDLSFVQILLSIMAFTFLFISVRRFVYREAKQTALKLLLNIFVWSGALLFSLNPSSARLISEALRLGENLNTLIFIGFVIVFGILFKILSIIERIERDITSIVKQDALRDIREKD
jgi:hypothetical protein